MAKLRIENKFGIAPNELLNDDTISFKAKGLFTFIQSKPDGWAFSAKRIARQSKDGVDGVKTALLELEKAGYLRRNKYQDTKGFWQIEYILSSEKSGENPVAENPTQDNPAQENPPTYSKKENSKKDKEKKNTDALVVSLIKEFEKVDVKNKGYYGNKTQRAKARFLIEQHGFDTVLKVIRLYLQMRQQNVEYLPVITSPHDLVEKWTKLARCAQQQIKKSDNVVW